MSVSLHCRVLRWVHAQVLLKVVMAVVINLRVCVHVILPQSGCVVYRLSCVLPPISQIADLDLFTDETEVLKQFSSFSDL